MWKQQFLDALNPTDTGRPDIERAMVLKARHLPSRLYRYRPIGRHSLDDLRNDTVWLTSPDKYNDPYDSALTLAGERLLPAVAGECLRRMPSGLIARGLFSEAELKEFSEAVDPLHALAERALREDPALDSE